MNWYEKCLLLILLFLVGICAYTDLKYGKVKNRVLLAALLLALPIHSAFFITGNAELGVFLVNVFVGMIFAISLYALGFWAAGDSKLLITILLIFPYTLYWNVNVYWMKSLSLILFFITITYGYVILDTIINIVAHLDMFLLTWKRTVTIPTTITFLKRWCVLVAITNIIYSVNSIWGGWSHTYVALTSFFVFIALADFIEKAKSLWGIALVMNLFCWITGGSTWDDIVYRVLIALLLFGFSKAIHTFNYKIIATEKLQAGMIISAVSIREVIREGQLQFLKEKMNEDIKTRLSENEVEIIKLAGIDYIRIVRKLPFAAFISIACVMYLIMEYCYAI